MQQVASNEDEEILYQDKYIKLTAKELTIFHYYLFLGLSKTIPLS
jgi:hypothetical protein